MPDSTFKNKHVSVFHFHNVRRIHPCAFYITFDDKHGIIKVRHIVSRVRFRCIISINDWNTFLPISRTFSVILPFNHRHHPEWVFFAFDFLPVWIITNNLAIGVDCDKHLTVIHWTMDSRNDVLSDVCATNSEHFPCVNQDHCGIAKLIIVVQFKRSPKA